MGYSQYSLAISHKSPTDILTLLALQPTGEYEEFPESPFVSASLPNGWFLVVANRGGENLTSDTLLKNLSADGEIVTCIVEEHVMFSEATYWRDGQRVWRVIHDAQKGSEHLETEGELPQVFEVIRDRLSTAQRIGEGENAGIDYLFDIPVELAKSLSGYRHDEDVPGLSDSSFAVLEPILSSSVKKSFVQRLFGK